MLVNADNVDDEAVLTLQSPTSYRPLPCTKYLSFDKPMRPLSLLVYVRELCPVPITSKNTARHDKRLILTPAILLPTRIFNVPYNYQGDFPSFCREHRFDFLLGSTRVPAAPRQQPLTMQLEALNPKRQGTSVPIKTLEDERASFDGSIGLPATFGTYF